MRRQHSTDALTVKYRVLFGLCLIDCRGAAVQGLRSVAASLTAVFGRQEPCGKQAMSVSPYP